MEHAKALEIAERLKAALAPFCERIEIAGSIRRGKPDVHDIEIVAAPKLLALMDMFGAAVSGANQLETHIGEWLPTKAHLIKNGPRYKQIALPDGINLDLFIVLPPSQWGVQLTLRTGPADFSKWVVTKRRLGGALPSHCRVCDGGVYEGDNLIAMPEEIDFLSFLKLGWLEPGERQARWGRRAATVEK